MMSSISMDDIIRPTAKVNHLIIALCVVVASLIVLLVLNNIGDALIPLFIIWALGIILWLTASVAEKFKSIEIGDGGLTVKTGVLSIKTTLISYKQIANLHIKQGLFERIIGVGTVELDTSGTNRVEIIMQSVKKEDIERISQACREGMKKVI